jgi:hypothetical protein
MNGICVESNWSQEYAYERYMSDIYDIAYKDLEYFPEGPEDWIEDRDTKIKALRMKR